jgi:hypothetical protein
MPHPQCPNIKNDILALRSKIGKLKNLKIEIFRTNLEYKFRQPDLQSDIKKINFQH